jgi:pSer/pThr/pTyr-binding forkhead associated (FHA) protein
MFVDSPVSHAVGFGKGLPSLGVENGAKMVSELFFLSHSRNGVLQAKIPLTDGRLVVGRSSRADLFVPDPSVSRRHAEVVVSGTNVSVRDLNSRNGTYVDDCRVTDSRVLPRQQIRFGSVSFLLTDDASLPDSFVSQQETTDARFLGDHDEIPVLEVLTVAQRRVFDLLMGGLLEKQVARELGISRHTVHNHIRVIYRAFGVHSRAELLVRVRPMAN